MKVANDRVDVDRSSLKADVSGVNGVKDWAHVCFDEDSVLAGVHDDAAMREFEDAPQGPDDVESRVSSAVRSQGLDLPGRLKSPYRPTLPPATLVVGRSLNELQSLRFLVF